MGMNMNGLPPGAGSTGPFAQSAFSAPFTQGNCYCFVRNDLRKKKGEL